MTRRPGPLARLLARLANRRGRLPAGGRRPTALSWPDALDPTDDPWRFPGWAELAPAGSIRRPDPATTVHVPPTPIAGAPGPPDPERTAFLAAVDHFQHGTDAATPPLRAAGVAGAIVDGTAGIVRSAAGQPLLDAPWAEVLLDEAAAKRSLHHRGPTEEWTPPAGPTLFLGNPWWANYYHWLMDLLPALAYLARSAPPPAPPTVLVPPGLPPAWRESLTAALATVGWDGAGAVRELPAGPVAVPHLVLPGPLHEPGNPSPWAVDWLREELGPAALLAGPGGTRPGSHEPTEPPPPSPATGPGPPLFLSRRDAHRRRIANAAALDAWLAERRVRTIRPAELSFAGQVAAARTAPAVLGPHGAGLANAVFAPAGTALIDLFPADYVNGCFWAAAAAGGQRYGYQVGGPEHDGAFAVDLDRLAALWERLQLLH